MNLKGLAGARGLGDEQSRLVEECAQVLDRNLAKHARRRSYYYDKVKPKNRTKINFASEYYNGDYSIGWAAKAVDALADRSVFDGYVFDGEVPQGFYDVIEDNDLAEAYSEALSSMLIEGVGFWTVANDGGVKIKYHDATTAGAVWDYGKRRIRACLVVNDWRRENSVYEPSQCVLYTSEVNVVIDKGADGVWRAENRPHAFGAPMAAAMAFKKTFSRPFGRSRVTPAVMAMVDAAVEEMMNMRMQSDYFSLPMKYVLGLSEDQFDDVSENMHRAYAAEMFLATNNEDGGTPTMGMLQAADMTPHIKTLDKLANMMASETCLPVASFGVSSNGYTSSDALRASTDDLVVLAQSMNKSNKRTMEQVAQMVLAVIGNKSLEELDENELTVSAHFENPSMPSEATITDAIVKQASIIPGFAETDVCLERLGYSEDDRLRIKNQTKAAANSAAIRERLANGSDVVARQLRADADGAGQSPEG